MRFLILCLSCFFLSQAFGDAKQEKWLAYYSDKAPIEAFEPYSLIVLDPDYHPSIKALKENGKTLLGYISLGEVDDKREWFEAVKKEGIILHENKNWPGSYHVDLRSPLWTKRVIEEIIPHILHKGFDGLMFDTLDNVGVDKSMIEGAVHLVQAIHLHYPDIPLMMNRGYEVLPKVEHLIDMMLAEGFSTNYDFKKKKYLLRPKKERDHQLAILKKAQKANPSLKLFALDYWYPKQPNEITKIYKTDREAGLNPYVGTINLDVIVPEP